MAINYVAANGLFTRIREIIDIVESLDTFNNATLQPGLAAALATYADLSSNSFRFQDVQAFVSAVRNQQRSSTIQQAARTLITSEIIRQLQAHDPAIRPNISEALSALVRQMKLDAQTIEKNTVTIGLAGIVGPEKPVLRLYSHEGLAHENYTVTVVNGAFRITGRANNEQAPYDWPPTGFSSVVPISFSANSLLSNPGFDLTPSVIADHPEDWNIEVGTIATTISHTGYTTQNIEITGGPASGYFTLTVTDLGGDSQITEPLLYNADRDAIESAIRALAGFENVVVTEVSATEFDVSFEGLGGAIPLMTAVDEFDAGGVTITDISSGQIGAAFAKSLYFSASGAEQTAISQRLTSLSANRIYGFCIRLKLSAATTGTMRIALVDGESAIINDDNGNANSYSIDVSGVGTVDFECFSTFFRTPTVMPAMTRLQIKMTTGLAAGNLFMDSAILDAARRIDTRNDMWAIAFEGLEPLQPDEQAALAVTNNQAGRFQTYFFRLFGTLLPSASVSTIPD